MSGIVMAQSRTASVEFTVPVSFRIVERTRQLAHNLFNSYRPELHYMRGPGPKWREKHGQQAAKADSGQLELPGLWQAGA
jgi:hypothetical protein